MSIDVVLDSCTVFWIDDLGMSISYHRRLQADSHLGSRVGQEVEDWLIENTKGDWNIWERGVWFAQKQDAALFKIFWHGQFP